jgi:hypothetical protein
MVARLVFLWGITLICAGECIQVEPQRFGRIDVSAFSALGDRISNLGIELRESGTGKDLSSLFKGTVADKVPYGTYTIRVWAPGSRSARREVQVMQPEEWIRMQLSVAMECSTLHEITGFIRNVNPNTEIWVKLLPVRGTGGAETPVGRNGAFLFSGLDDGPYLLVVMEGSSVVHTRAVKAFEEMPLDIDVGKKAGVGRPPQ